MPTGDFEMMRQARMNALETENAELRRRLGSFNTPIEMGAVLPDDYEPIFSVSPETSNSLLELRQENNEVLRFEHDGRVFINGRLAITDNEIVDGLRRFLRDAGYGQVEPPPERDTIERKGLDLAKMVLRYTNMSPDGSEEEVPEGCEKWEGTELDYLAEELAPLAQELLDLKEKKNPEETGKSRYQILVDKDAIPLQHRPSRRPQEV
jgi:hypothetical protein